MSVVDSGADNAPRGAEAPAAGAQAGGQPSAARDYAPGSRVYIGDLPQGTTADDLNAAFEKFGALTRLELKVPREGRNPFAFVVFESPEAANGAVSAMNGTSFNGATIKVEISREKPERRERAEGDRDRERRGGDRDRRDGGRDGGRGGGGGRRPGYRLRITGLPPDASWQDCKDFIRRAGIEGIGHADTEDGGRTGIVEVFSLGDVDRAVRALDNSEFQGRQPSARGFVRVEEERGSSGGGGGGGGYGGGYRDDRNGGYGGYPPRDDRGGYGGGYYDDRRGPGGYGGGYGGYAPPPADPYYRGAPPPPPPAYGGTSSGGRGGAPPAPYYDDRRGGELCFSGPATVFAACPFAALDSPLVLFPFSFLSVSFFFSFCRLRRRQRRLWRRS